MWVWPLGQEDPMEEGTAAHSNTLASRIPRKRSLAGYSPWGCRVGHDWSDLAQHSIPQFIALHFITLQYCGFYKINWRCVTTLHLARLLIPVFKSICSFWVSVSHFGNSHNILNILIIIFFVMVICDQCSLVLLWFTEGWEDG